MEHLVAILTGDLTDNVQKFNHEELPTFGVGKDRKPAEWRSIFRQLSAVGLIAQDLMEHGRWWVTDEGWRVLKGEQKIELRKDLAVAKAGSRRDRRAAAAAVIVDDADVVLLDSAEGAADPAGACAERAVLRRLLRPHSGRTRDASPDDTRCDARNPRSRRRQARTLWRRLS